MSPCDVGCKLVIVNNCRESLNNCRESLNTVYFTCICQILYSITNYIFQNTIIYKYAEFVFTNTNIYLIPALVVWPSDELVCTITRQRFKLGSPFLHRIHILRVETLQGPIENGVVWPWPLMSFWTDLFLQIWSCPCDNSSGFQARV